MNDENELISGQACWAYVKPRGAGWEFAREARWRWLDIGGGGPVVPAEPGTVLRPYAVEPELVGERIMGQWR